MNTQETKREQTDYCEIIGITEVGEIIMLDYTFVHTPDFRGATGTIFMPVYQDDIDSRNDIDNVKDSYGYLWSEAVANGQTTESLDDFMEQMIEAETNYGDGYFLGHDTSYIHKIPDAFKQEHFPDAVTFECIGGGRCFSHDTKWAKLLRPDLLKELLKFEKRETKLKIIKGGQND